MESEAKRPRRVAFAAIIAAVLAVAALTGTLMGCAPSAPASDAGRRPAATTLWPVSR